MRVGLLIPAVNTVTEEEFHAGTPDDVTVHTARMAARGTSDEAVREMVAESLPRAVQDVAAVRPDLVVLACTAVGAVLGPEGEAELVERLAQELSVPVVSMNSAVGQALERTKARRVAVVTPYPEPVTEQVADGLRTRGFEVVVTGSMGFEDAFGIAAIPLEELLQFVEQTVAGHEFDALFVSCGNLRMRTARDALAERYGVPVVGSNPATLDAALELIESGREAVA